jgi:D-3-phosphoglycerate dehydrogenase
MNNKTSFPKKDIKILLLEGVHPATIEAFHAAGYTNIIQQTAAMEETELMNSIPDFHVLGIRSKTNITAGIIEKAHKLINIGCFCIGTNQVDMAAATNAGIAVFNSPFSNTRSVAELVIADSIMLIRKIIMKNNAAHQGIWLKDSKDCFEVRGKTLGIIGYGHIGSQVSVLAEGLGMKVIYFDIEPKLPLGNAEPMKTLDKLLKKADIITLHVPETKNTKNMINEKTLAMMKQGAILLNLSRGDVMDIMAVKEALKSNHLAGLAVDVFPMEPVAKGDKFSSPLQGMDNVILTPHIGGSTVEAQKNIGIDVSTKLINYLDTGSSVGSLSVPALSLPVQHNAHRLLHIHKNIPGVLSEINGLMSQMNVNILGQYLKTNESIGYVVLDVDKKTPDKMLHTLKTVKGTIKTRNLY